jgi:hypothetical protein
MADYAEIRVLTTGPTLETAALTLAITFSYSPKAVDAFKALIPYADRAWSADDKVWYVKQHYLGAIKEFARLFDSAMVVDGNRWEDLRTGRVFEQGDLFQV